MTNTKIAFNAISSAAALFCCGAAAAGDFTLGADIQGKFNANITVGSSYRTDDPDPGVLGTLSSARVAGTPAGQLGANTGGADLNFSKGQAVSTVYKSMADIELKKDNTGVFVRAKYWKDTALSDVNRPYGNYPNGFTAGQPLSDNGFDPEAKFTGLQFVDYFAFSQFNVGGAAPMDVRLGRQFLNWGDARLVGGGVNVINPVNVAGLTRPGALPEESKLPVGMLHGKLQNTKELGVEAFVQYEQRAAVLAGCGTFYANPGYAPTGCNYVSVLPTLDDPTALAAGRYVHRAADVNASDSGQFGLSSRFSPADMSTDFRFYAMNLHSRTASVRVINPNVAGTYGTLGTTRLTDPNGLQYAMLYPENNQIYGMSFLSKLSPSAQVFGEIAYRPNQPINLNASDLIAAFFTRSPTSALNLAKGTNSIPVGGTFDGYDRFQVTNVSLGSTKIFPDVMGAKTLNVTGELGLSYVAGLPDAGTLRYGRSDDYGTAAINGQACTDTTAAQQSCAQTGFVTPTSWGYRLRLAATYPDAFFGAAITPAFYFANDVSGYSFDGSFQEGRRILRPSVRANWGKQYYAELAYNVISGGAYNNQTDRDTLTVFAGINF